jgi:23S rRNA pseudouridine1911/1915/1917 synthase
MVTLVTISLQSVIVEQHAGMVTKVTMPGFRLHPFPCTVFPMPRILLDWLIEKYPTAKKQTLKRMVQAKRVTVNGRPAIALKQPLTDADKVAVDERPAGPKLPPSHTLQIIHEDADILVLDKPVGLLTSTVPREPRATLWAMAREYMQATDPQSRVGLIHRLDKDASGILVFSKNDAAYRSLKSQFFDHTVRREYTIIVHGVPKPPAGRIESHLVERADGTVHPTKQIGKGQLAITNYELIRSANKRSLVRVILETGRKHQIRVHFSQRGMPIVGDKVYGQEDEATRLMLAATTLTIKHPRDGKEMTFEIKPPVTLLEEERQQTRISTNLHESSPNGNRAGNRKDAKIAKTDAKKTGR